MNINPYLQQVTQHFPQFAGEAGDAVLNLSGWDSVVLEVAGRWIFRIPRREEVRAGLAREIALLRELREALPLPVPDHQLIARDLEGEVLFSGYPRLAGASLEGEHLKASRVAGAIGDFLTCLHAYPVERSVQTGAVVYTRESWQAVYREFYAWIRDSVFPLLAQEEREDALRFWEGFLGQEHGFDYQPALIHGDLGAEHILYNPTTQSVTGIIDLEDVCIGDPALDFAGIFALAGEPGLERVLQAYRRPLDPLFLARVRFYTYAIPFHAIRFGLEMGEDALVQEGLEQVQSTRGRSE